MNTLTVILEPDSNGTVHLKLPDEMMHGKIKVVATTIEEPEIQEPPSSPEAETAFRKRIEELRKHVPPRRQISPEELERRRQTALKALEKLAKSDPYREIDDPVAWQRQIREDRPLPGRDQ